MSNENRSPKSTADNETPFRATPCVKLQDGQTRCNGWQSMIDFLFLLVTGFIAYHGITYRNEEGETDFVRLLFGCIALLFFFRVLLADVVGIWS